ncbi:hypothetical protein FV304_24600, partial [Escherichia coli]
RKNDFSDKNDTFAKLQGCRIQSVPQKRHNLFNASSFKPLCQVAYSALFDHGLASKSDQRFASIRSTGNLTFSTAF